MKIYFRTLTGLVKAVHFELTSGEPCLAKDIYSLVEKELKNWTRKNPRFLIVMEGKVISYEDKDYLFSGLFFIGIAGFSCHASATLSHLWQCRNHLDVDWLMQNRQVGIMLLSLSTYNNHQLLRTSSSIGVFYILYEVVTLVKLLIKRYVQEFGEIILEAPR